MVPFQNRLSESEEMKWQRVTPRVRTGKAITGVRVGDTVLWR